jgi:hypothetical protein
VRLPAELEESLSSVSFDGTCDTLGRAFRAPLFLLEASKFFEVAPRRDGGRRALLLQESILKVANDCRPMRVVKQMRRHPREPRLTGANSSDIVTALRA